LSDPPAARIIIVTGVTGSGKTTVGRALAARLGWRFHDADDLHALENVERMRRGEPLDDQLRQPWLHRVRRVVEDAAQTAGAVIACSALKESYRRVLSEGIDGVRFVLLNGEPALLRKRLEQRAGHFAGSELLESQLAALEPPAYALTVDITLPVDAIVDRILRELS
jgi:carbohydrate kinase (thermoresistant glucokinase family)